MLLAGLPGEAAFVRRFAEDQRARDPFQALGYERPAQRVSIDAFAALTGEGGKP